ncbi:hypothetical protein SAMN05428969_2844 [Devosia sp. YR412]|uniref:hypothetical protein n=1 Tax=Devosia sp. YR412 TaxID=1881030 RepID=UPI0008BE4605|nr:hypothetical protein [Devosia sp. YR412]SEQ38214.1 hypothetical protein SAMN05428969_2844 [Devosia sp. YR412]
MANKTIDDLASATLPLTGAERFHLVQGLNSRKATADRVRGFAEGGTAALAEGDLLYVSAGQIITRLPKGTAGQVLRQNAGLTAPEWASAPFTKEYNSGAQVIVSGGALTLAHGLGVAPKLTSAYLICHTATAGYAAADIIEAPHNNWDGASSVYGFAVEYSGSTNLLVRFGSNGFVFNHKTTGATAIGTGANWYFGARAWA